MSTLKSSAENLTLNADGSGNDVIIQSNGSTLVTVDGSQSSVGIGTATPTGNAKLHIYNGASGQASSSNNTEVVVENSSNTGIHFLTPNTAVSGLWFGDPEDNDVGRMYYAHSDNSLQIFTDGDAQVRIDSDGIKFGTDTAAANALDDYEEGTYQPTLTGSTSGSFNTASYTYLAYTKIGRVVHIQGYLNIGSESSCVGSITMSLPFTCSSSLSQDSENAAMTVSLRDHGGSGLDNITGTVAVAGMRFVSLSGSGADNVLDASDVDTVWNIRIGGSYIAA